MSNPLQPLAILLHFECSGSNPARFETLPDIEQADWRQRAGVVLDYLQDAGWKPPAPPTDVEKWISDYLPDVELNRWQRIALERMMRAR